MKELRNTKINWWAVDCGGLVTQTREQAALHKLSDSKVIEPYVLSRGLSGPIFLVPKRCWKLKNVMTRLWHLISWMPCKMWGDHHGWHFTRMNVLQSFTQWPRTLATAIGTAGLISVQTVAVSICFHPKHHALKYWSRFQGTYS